LSTIPVSSTLLPVISPGDLRGKLVLDAGVGAGRFTDVMTRWGAHVIGVDLSFPIEAAHQNFCSPQFRGIHTPAEIETWFREAGLIDIHSPGSWNTAMRGIRPRGTDRCR
jgi:hypothetical protein